MVIRELNDLTRIYLDQDELERNVTFNQNLEQQKANWLDARSRLRKQVEENRSYLRTLYMDKVKGLVSPEDYVAMADSFAADRQRLETQIKEADLRLEELDARMLAGDQRRELIRQYTHVEHLTREMVEVLIDYITVGKRIPGTHEVPIEIHWNF